MGPRAGLSLFLLGFTLGCAGPPQAPSPPELLMIGTVAEVRVDDARHFVLQDGRVIDVSPPIRILFEGGQGQPLVLGRDADGTFVGVFMGQDGLPADCHLPGLGPTGINRGPFIEIHGILWRKAAGFSSVGAPTDGAAYPGSTRFCFNDRAEVAYTVPG